MCGPKFRLCIYCVSLIPDVNIIIKSIDSFASCIIRGLVTVVHLIADTHMVFFALNICWCPIFSCLLGKRNIFQGYDRCGITGTCDFFFTFLFWYFDCQKRSLHCFWLLIRCSINHDENQFYLLF